MKVILTRTDSNDKQTVGTLRIFKGKELLYTCATIEPPWLQNKRMKSCIPTGMYMVKKRQSLRFKDHFHVLDVPGRTWILIHAGNFRRNSTGCILVGKKHADIDGDGVPDLASSKAALKELLEIMPDRFRMEIKNES